MNLFEVNPLPWLLIGSCRSVFFESPLPFDACANIFEGISILQRKKYERIFMVYNAIPEPRAQAVRTLSEIAADSKIELLVRMHEESAAIELMRSLQCRGIISDYHIAPLSIHAIETGPAAIAQEDLLDSKTMMESDKDKRIRELEKLVTQDDLTGLKNRRYIRHFLPTILNRAGMNGCQVTLLLFDIDDFKHYNDAYGHAVGDNVLRQAARLIQRCCRAQDVVARLGGDEFAVVFWNTPETLKGRTETDEQDRRGKVSHHPREAIFMAERFRKEMSEALFEYLGPKGKGSLTISGGLSTYPIDAKTAEELFEKADHAMLEAKRSGKNQIYLVGQPKNE